MSPSDTDVILSSPRPVLSMWVIYENPIDYPGKWVTRKWVGDKPCAIPESVCTNIDDARKAVPGYAVMIPRFEDDDRCIAEVWI